MTSSEASGKDQQVISLKEIIWKTREWGRYFISNWVIIFIVGLIGGIAGFVYAYYQKPLYKAELTFVLESGSSGGLGAYAGLASQIGIGTESQGGVFEGQNLLALMKSRSMIEKTLLTAVEVEGKKLTLADFYVEISGLRKKWAEDGSSLANLRFVPGSDTKLFTLEQNSLFKGFHAALVANNLYLGKKDKHSSIIALQVTSENELFSKYFAEVLAKEVSDFYIETKTKKSIQNLAILQHQADSVRREFNAAISGVAYSIDANPNANLARQALQVPSQRRQVDAQANQAMLMELIRNIELSKMTLREETPLIQVVDRPILPLDKAEANRKSSFIQGGLLSILLLLIFLAVKKIIKDL